MNGKHLIALAALAWAGIGGAGSAAADALSGTVSAPAGQDVAGTVLIVCVPSGDSCDESRSGAVEVEGSGRSGTFSAEGVPAGDYVLIAWKDLNGNGEIDDADLFGFHADGAPVSPPAHGLAVAMVGPGSAGGGEPAPSPGGPASGVPAEVAGNWHRELGGSAYNTATGSFTTSDVVLAPDGRFQWTTVHEYRSYACPTRTVREVQGTYAAQGDVLVFQVQAGHSSYRSCDPSKNESRNLGGTTEAYRWAIGPDSDGRERLWLVSQSGDETSYWRR